MMLQQINKKIIFYISLVIILGTFNNKNLKNFDLPKINVVNIEGIEFNDNEYLKIMNLIKSNNLLSIQKSQIKEILNSNNLIEEYEVFKKYPSSLEIKIEKKLKFPVVIKPINEGSSVNVFICTKKYIKKKNEVFRRL